MLDLKVEKKIQTCGKFLLVLHRTPVVAKPKPLVWSEQVEVAFLIDIKCFMKLVEVHFWRVSTWGDLVQRSERSPPPSCRPPPPCTRARPPRSPPTRSPCGLKILTRFKNKSPRAKIVARPKNRKRLKRKPVVADKTTASSERLVVLVGVNLWNSKGG